MKESSTEVINEVPIVNHQDVKLKIGHFLKVYGPGLIVMLADTDAGLSDYSGSVWCAMGVCNGFTTITTYSNPVCSARNDGSPGHRDTTRPW